jgi:hypothetical protein
MVQKVFSFSLITSKDLVYLQSGQEKQQASAGRFSIIQVCAK